MVRSLLCKAMKGGSIPPYCADEEHMDSFLGILGDVIFGAGVLGLILFLIIIAILIIACVHTHNPELIQHTKAFAGM